MLQSLIDAGTITGDITDKATRDQAIAWIKRDFRPRYIKANKYANIEMARETEMDGFITDPIEVYQKYVDKASKRLAQLHEFGSTPDLVLAHYALKHFKEGTNYQGLEDARDAILSILGTKIEEPMVKDLEFGMNFGITISTGLLLQHSAMVQPSTATNMIMVGGLGRFIKGLTQTLRNVQVGSSTMGDPIYARDWARIAGVLQFTMNKELHDIVIDEKTKETTDKILRSFGITQIDGMMRLVGAMVGKMYGIDMALLYIKKPSPKNRAKLKRLGLDPDKIMARHQAGTITDTGELLTAAELRRSALAFTEETNFVVNTLTAPVFLKNHPLGKVFMLFSRFAYQQHNLWLTVLKDNSGKALRGILAGITIGAPALLLKMLLMGDDPEKVLEKEGVARLLWRAFTTGGGPGLFVEAFVNAIMAAATGNYGAMKSPKRGVDSPMFGIAETFGKGMKASAKYAIGEDTDEGDLHDAMKALYSATQVGMLTMTPPRVGVPANAVLGVSRPMIERALFPTDRQKDTSYLH
jgi:hypothetical protein